MGEESDFSVREVPCGTLVEGKKNFAFLAILCGSRLYADYDDPRISPELRHTVIPALLMLHRWDGRFSLIGGEVEAEDCNELDLGSAMVSEESTEDVEPHKPHEMPQEPEPANPLLRRLKKEMKSQAGLFAASSAIHPHVALESRIEVCHLYILSLNVVDRAYMASVLSNAAQAPHAVSDGCVTWVHMSMPVFGEFQKKAYIAKITRPLLSHIEKFVYSRQ